jgi:hypothetical protein
MKYGIAGGEQISNQLAERAALAAGTRPSIGRKHVNERRYGCGGC